MVPHVAAERSARSAAENQLGATPGRSALQGYDTLRPAPAFARGWSRLYASVAFMPF